MKFLVEISDANVGDLFPERTVERCLQDIKETLEIDSCFIDVKVTVFTDGVAA